ncbi:MAG: response regulator transcription factor [Bacteroidetes bacterium]|nr:response regulator transcription factor [Bacteroidota bacterium]
MIKTIIIEDEQKSREVLLSIITKHCPMLQVVGQATNVTEGVNLIKNENPELVFLDISMPDGSGFDLLEKTSNNKFEVIFATASDQHAIKAIKYSACDYLLKPIDADELKTAVDKILQKKNTAQGIENINFLIQQLKRSDENFQKITLPTGNAYEVINLKDIIHCSADGSYTKFHLSDSRTLLVSFSLKHYEELLPENEFFRVHHQHLINTSHVIRVLKEDSGYAIMSDGSKIEISRRKKDDFLKYLNHAKK